MNRSSLTLLALLLVTIVVLFGDERPSGEAKLLKNVSSVSADPHDLPMYNRDCIGTRYNSAESTLGKENVSQLVEKWRFPPVDSTEKVGVVHATVVVNGHVYFGTETT